MPTEISIEAGDWDPDALDAWCQAGADATLIHQGLEPEECAISVAATDDAHIAALNQRYRNKTGPTNVLSWPAQDLANSGGEPRAPRPDAFGDIELGDIALAWETCQREAREGGKPLEHHVTHLIVHGVLHLLGYDHIRDDDATLMETHEITILAQLGVPNPYDSAD